MNKYIYQSLLFLIFALNVVTTLAETLPSENVERVILSEDPWPPYILGEEGQSATGGIAVDILEQVFLSLGVQLEMRLYPWRRSLKLVKNGIEDGHLLITHAPRWDKYLIYSNPFIVDRFLLWSLKKGGAAIKWQNFEDLKSYRIAITNSYAYGEEFDKEIIDNSLKIFRAATDELNFKLLLAGRHDAFVCLDTVAKSLFKNNPNFAGQFVSSDKPIAQSPLYMALSKQSPAAALMPEINLLLKKMADSGQIKSIISQYK